MMDTLVPKGYCKKLRIKIGITCTLSKISSKINIKNSVILILKHFCRGHSKQQICNKMYQKKVNRNCVFLKLLKSKKNYKVHIYYNSV